MKKVIFLVLTIAMANTASAQNRQFTAEKLWAMTRVGSYCPNANGQKVVYNVSTYSVEKNNSETTIKQLTLIGNKPVKGEVQIQSFGKGSAPKYINGGSQITYLAADKDGKMQLWVMDATNGEGKKQISFCDKDVEDYLFSPNEKKVILIHSIPSHNSIAKKDTDLPKASARVVTEVMYRHWDEWVESIQHPFVADFNGEKIGEEYDMLEGEPYECPMKPFGGAEQLAWAPDSKSIAYTCRKKTGVDYATSTDSDIYLFDLESMRTVRNFCKPSLDWRAPAYDATLSLQNQMVNHLDGDLNVGYDINPKFSPDGKMIAWQSMEHDGYESDRNRLCIMDLATGQKHYVTEEFDSNVDDYCWNTDSRALFFVGVWHGETHIHKVDIRKWRNKVTKLTKGQYDYTSLQLLDNGNLIVARQSMCEPTDLFALNITKKTMRQITDENKEIKTATDWGTVEPRWSKTVDGKDLLSWIVLPPNFDKTKKYPTLLFCEGGPQSPVSQFWSFRWNMMIMAAHGYVVVAPNRRGLPGFGTAWNDEISTNYGGHCMDDLLSAIDDAADNLPYVDKDHLGCIGASFGGYSVYWLAGHHQKRFKAFIAHDGIYNFEQQYVETEEAWFTNWDLGGAPWQKTEATQRTYRNSPHRFVDQWDTPILCIHGERDFRIVASQAMSAFNAARYRGIDAELFIAPDENHWVLKPQNGVLWQRTFFRWLDKYLK
ncbi:MAG: S9 family peptidase [Prevotella sp.]|nr:S9 family peptidase [Candidatus Equicola faecalis]